MLCSNRADDLAAFLATIDTTEVPLPVEPATLVVRDDLAARPTTYAVAVKLLPDGVELQGRRIETRDDLADSLAEAHRRVTEARGPADPTRIDLIVDRRATWDRVVAVFAAAHGAGFTRPAFVFASSRVLAPPPRTAIDDRLDEITRSANPSDRASQLAREVEKLVAKCEAIGELFGAVAGVEVDNKAQHILAGVRDAVVACHCRVDLDQLRSVLWRVIAIPEPKRLLAVEAAPDAPPLTAPATAIWADVAPRLDARASKLWLAVN